MVEKLKSGLASIADVGRIDILFIDPRKIKIIPGWNARNFNDPENIEAVNVIARSIEAVGFKRNKPLTVVWEDGQCRLLNGETRLRGALKAIENGVELKNVPCVAGDRHANEADRIFDQSLDNAGRPFKDLEQATNWKRLVDLGWQQGEIAKRHGISASRVSQILGLLTLPEPVKAMVVAGNVSATLAVQAVAQNGSKAEQVLKAGLEVAKSDGKTKVTAANLTGESRKVNIRTLLKECLDASDVDDDNEEFVVVKMPVDMWKKLRDESGW